MNFWYPSFLIFGVLVAIPIIIHLFNFRRFRKVYYSNVALVKATVLQSKKQREVLKWLLLAIRVCVVGGLVMAFAKPIWGEQEERSKDLFLLVDNSIAVNFGVSQETDFVEALKVTAAESLIEQRFFASTNTTVFQKKINSAQFIEALNTDKSSLTLPNKLGDILEISDAPKAIVSPFSRMYDFQEDWIKSNRLELVYTPAPSSKMVKVDSVYWSETSTQDNQVLSVDISGTASLPRGQAKLYLNNNLVSVTPIENSSSLDFNLGKQKGEGELRLYDERGMQFSSFFFVAREIKRFKVVEVSAEQGILERGLNPERFEYSHHSLSNFDFDIISGVDVAFIHAKKGQLKAAQLIVDAFLKESKTVCLVVTEVSNMSSYGVKVEELKTIDSTAIAFPKHKLYSGVFLKTNRKNPVLLPKANTSLKLTTVNPPILQTQHRNGLLVQSVLNPNLFVSVLDVTATNDFTNHAMYIPTLYQIVFSSQANQQLYHRTYNYVKVKDAERHSLQGELRSQELAEIKTGTQPYVLLPKDLIGGIYQLDSVPIAVNPKVNLKEYEFYSKEELLRLADSLGNVSVQPFQTFNEKLKTYNQKGLSQGEWRVTLLLVLALLVMEVVVIRVNAYSKS